MHKIFIIISCLFSLLNAGNYFSDKGTIWLYGNLGFNLSRGNYTDADDNITWKEISIFTETELYYFPIKSFYFGPLFSWMEHFADRWWLDNRVGNLSLGGILGTLFTINMKLFPYLQFGAASYTMIDKDNSNETGILFIGRFGIIIPLKDRIGLQIEPWYSFINLKYENIQKIGISIGFIVYKDKFGTSIMLKAHG
jgi:hypothetical protein